MSIRAPTSTMLRLLLAASLLLSAPAALAQDVPEDDMPAEYPSHQNCYYTILDGQQGWCEDVDCCEGEYYVSDLCPNYPSKVKCCFSRNTCSMNEGCNNYGACSSTVQSLACEILDLYELGRIYLKPEHFDSRGNSPYDGAASLSNIRDTCLGVMAKRSSYENAPGGCTCLHSSMLETMRDYAEQYYAQYGAGIEINAIAGSSHSVNSWHYEGNTMDVGCTTPVYHCEEIEDFCRARGAIELCYPGSSCGGHETWVHCAMPLD